jgi:hypothetical protein
MTDTAAEPSPASRAVELARTLHDHYAEYHDHKEAMAYAGFTLFLGIVGAALFTDKWPPKPATWWAVPAVVVAWLAMLFFLKFQLIRRRWAALRQAGCERLLARWATNPPTPQDLRLWTTESRASVSRFVRVIDWIYPLKDAVRAVKTDQSIYPTAFVDAWKARELEGTEAIAHERLVVLAGWALFGILMYHTL